MPTPQDPAKWTGAIGGFAGFVAGAPIKVGAKIAQKALPKLGAKQLEKIGKESVETVVKGMKEAGKQEGLSPKAIREVTKGYRSLVREAQVDPRLKGLNKKMKDAASNLEFEEAAKIRDEIRKLEATELEITLNPK